MNKKQIEIRNFLVNKINEKYTSLGIDFSVEEISDNFSLTDSGVFDSMEFLGFITELEDKFSIEIDFSKQDPSQMTRIIGVLKAIKVC